MKHRVLVGCGAAKMGTVMALCFVLLPSAAKAAPANGAGAIPQGTWVVSAERLAGVYRTDQTTHEDGDSFPAGLTTITLLG